MKQNATDLTKSSGIMLNTEFLFRKWLGICFFFLFLAVSPKFINI